MNTPSFFLPSDKTLDGFIINALKNGNNFNQIVHAFTEYIRFVCANEQTSILKLSTHIDSMEKTNQNDRKIGGRK